jgi:uncharacterized membrane protein
VTLDLVDKWNVKYIIVGNPERSYVQKYCSDPQHLCNSNTVLRKFDVLFEAVFSQGQTTIYEVP